MMFFTWKSNRTRQILRIQELLNKPLELMILKMDKYRATLLFQKLLQK